MLKTNTKAVKEAVNNYVIDAINDTIEDGDTLAQKCAIILDWYYSANARTVNRYGVERFEYDTPLNIALTNTLGVCTFYTSEQKELLKNWLQETEEEADQYNNAQIEKLFTNLTGRAFRELMEKYDLRVIQTEGDRVRNDSIIDNGAEFIIWRVEVKHVNSWQLDSTYKLESNAQEIADYYIAKGRDARVVRAEVR